MNLGVQYKTLTVQNTKHSTFSDDRHDRLSLQTLPAVLNNRSLNSLVDALWLRNACHRNSKTATPTLAGILGRGMDAGLLTTRIDSYQSICIWSLQAHLCLLQHGVFGAVGSDVGQISEVTLRRARLVLGWVTVWGVQLLVREIYLSLTNHPGQLSLAMGKRNEYWSKVGDALRLGVKADMVLFAGNTVWSISEHVRGVCTYTRYTNPRILYFYFTTSARVLSRRWTLIALFSHVPVALHFNLAILTIRIRVLYGSIIWPNTNSLFGALFGSVRIWIECLVLP